MFNLEHTISEWRRQMLSAGIKNPVPLEELEIHLREEIEHHTKSGLNEAEAFQSAVEKIGQAHVLQREFNKVPNSKTMKTSRILGRVAIVFFVISFFLPAYDVGFYNYSGFAGFRLCWNALLGNNDDFRIFSGGWFYYGGFVVSNVLFIGLAAALFVTQERRKLSSIVSVVAFLHVLSWIVLVAVVPIISGKSSQIADLGIGYYVWLTAYALLVTAHLWGKPAESLASNMKVVAKITI